MQSWEWETRARELLIHQAAIGRFPLKKWEGMKSANVITLLKWE